MAASCSRVAWSRAAACWRSNASVAPSGSCSSSVPAELAASATPANSRSSAATRSSARASSAPSISLAVPMTRPYDREVATGVSKWAERARSSPYYPALRHPVFRKVLPGAAMSALGDGMSAVAIAWLALKLAPPGSRGLWVGAAVAAYSLPGAAGAVALRRWLRGRGGARLAFVNAVLRAAALGLIGCLAIAKLLDPEGYVALLGISSLLSAWGLAGKYTLIADLLPAEHRVAGNTVFGLADQLSLMIGPALAGVVTALAGPAVVIALDAASWVVLAVSYARIAPLAARLAPAVPPAPAVALTEAPAASLTEAPAAAPTGPPAAVGAWAMIRSSPVLPGLLALSFVFYLLYGPVEHERQ